MAVVKMMLYFGSVMLPAEPAFPRGGDSDHFHGDFPTIVCFMELGPQFNRNQFRTVSAYVMLLGG